MLKVRERLDANCMVGMLADRTLLDDAAASLRRLPLLGAPAAFPLGPLYMAAMLKRPVIFMTGLYRDGNRYDVHFETLADFSDVRRDARRPSTRHSRATSRCSTNTAARRATGSTISTSGKAAMPRPQP